MAKPTKNTCFGLKKNISVKDVKAELRRQLRRFAAIPYLSSIPLLFPFCFSFLFVFEIFSGAHESNVKEVSLPLFA